MGSISGELGAKSVNLSKPIIWANSVDLLSMYFLLIWEERDGLPVFQLQEHGQNGRQLRRLPDSSTLTSHPIAHGRRHCPLCKLLLLQVRSTCSLNPGDFVPDGTNRQNKTHITETREVCYPWHPCFGQSVLIKRSMVRIGKAIFWCSIWATELSGHWNYPSGCSTGLFAARCV